MAVQSYIFLLKHYSKPSYRLDREYDRLDQ